MLRDEIKRVAKERRISLERLEELAGIGKNSISKWDRVSPSIKTVAAVADVLGVSLDELYGRKVPRQESML